MRRHIDHVTVRVKDHEAAETFYRATLGALGFQRNVDVHGRVSFGTDAGHDFGFYSDGDEFFKQAHVAFVAPSREAVDRFHQAARDSVASPWTRRETGRSSVACTQRTSRP
jgi:catechol 2,3-dioxygenase-like lactoylglutathione lyase family enzyme